MQLPTSGLSDRYEDALMTHQAPLNIVILTGAGISAESGLSTFRDEGGLWAGHRIDEVCTPDALARNPDLVCAFYDERKAAASSASPNAAHLALAELEHFWVNNKIGDYTLITQNVDDLHERAGSRSLIQMHGRLNASYCCDCGFHMVRHAPLEGNRDCPSCHLEALRPDIVLFGEAPRELPKIQTALACCHLFVAVGTSGTVFPAAGFAEEARGRGAATLLLNLEQSQLSENFLAVRLGPASQIVPAWVSEIIGTAANALRSDRH